MYLNAGVSTSKDPHIRQTIKTHTQTYTLASLPPEPHLDISSFCYEPDATECVSSCQFLPTACSLAMNSACFFLLAVCKPAFCLF